MTQEALFIMILSLCENKNPKRSFEQKQECIEHYVNCAIYDDGKIDLDRCKKFKFEEGEKDGTNKN